jgi:ubiquinone/menaquinone biosynthesis C-methylase UbiE
VPSVKTGFKALLRMVAEHRRPTETTIAMRRVFKRSWVVIAKIKRTMRGALRYCQSSLSSDSEGLRASKEYNFDPNSFVIHEPTSTVNLHPSVSARFRPLFGNQTFGMIPKPAAAKDCDPTDGFPIPPQELWAGYGAKSEEYIVSGREHFESMMRVMDGVGVKIAAGQRVLDLGCAAGRMIRCFRRHADNIQAWGVDQSAPHVLWCRQNLSPACKFVATTTLPHLPFEDNYFDFIYASSVFTHIGDLEDAWLMELRRITRPRGTLFITVADDHTVEILMSSPPGHWLHNSAIRQQLVEFENSHHFLESGYQMIMTMWAPGNAQIIHDRQYIEKHWSCYFEILSIAPVANGYQTAIVMRKSEQS